MIPAKGSTHRGKGRPPLKGKRRSMITFDDDQHEEIRQRAIEDGISFTKMATLLIEWGLEA